MGCSPDPEASGAWDETESGDFSSMRNGRKVFMAVWVCARSFAGAVPDGARRSKRRDFDTLHLALLKGEEESSADGI